MFSSFLIAHFTIDNGGTYAAPAFPSTGGVSTPSISSSSCTHDSRNRGGPLMMRRAMSSLGSLCSGLLQRSIVLAVALEPSSHHVSHQSHSCGREKMGTWCCAKFGKSWSKFANEFGSRARLKKGQLQTND